MPTAKIVLITGGNRGLGLEAGRQLAIQGHIVVLGSRDLAKGEAAVAALAAEGLQAETVQLDVSDPVRATACVEDVQHRHGRLDVLVNNAGIRLDMGSALTVAPEILQKTLDINVVSALRMAQLAIPIMRANEYGRIVNVSSMLGQLSGLGTGQGAYRISKASLNAVTAMLAVELGSGRRAPIKVNSASPGWTRTEMGGPSAARSLAEGADTTVWLATLPSDGPTGGFFHDRKQIDW